TLRTIKVFLRPRTALRRHGRIPSVPLEGLGAAKVLDQPVVHDVLAKPVRLQVPRHTIKRRINVAVRAAELPLKGIARCGENLLPVPQRSDVLRTTQVDRS